jgi:hypothetical protein
MRKLIPILVALLVVAMAAPVGAKKVVNESYKQYDIGVDRHDEIVDLNAWAFEGTSGSGFGIRYDAFFGGCSEPTEAIEWVSIHGDGHLVEVPNPVVPSGFLVDPLKGKDKFTTGKATGVFDWGTLDYWRCNDTGDTINLADPDLPLQFRSFSIDMDGTGGELRKWSDRQCSHVPGNVNECWTVRGESRDAFGFVDIGYPGPWEVFANGAIGQSAHSHHSNEH